MERLDTYLHSVARFLPAADREDIVRELADNLRSQIEDREEQLHHPLSDEELKVLLEAFGTPLEVAGRYRQANGVVAFGPVLIGPVLFPFYTRILGFLLGLTACAIVVIGLALRIPAASYIKALLLNLSMQFGIVTLIFALAEFGLAKRPRAFDVSYRLSYLTPRTPDAAPRVSRLESLSQIVMLAILLAWLPAFADFARGAVAQAGLAPAAVWNSLYLALACLWIAGIVRAAVNLLRPTWIRFWTIARFALDVAWLGVVIVLLRAGRWVVPLDSGLPSADARVAAVVNHWVVIFLVVTAVLSVMAVLLDVRRSMATR